MRMGRWQARMAHLCLQLEVFFTKVLERLLFQQTSPDFSPKHVLVYHVGNLGDTVVAIPALHHLRQAFPNACLTLLTSSGRATLPGASEVLQVFPGLVDRIIPYQPEAVKSWRGLQRLRQDVRQTGAIDLFVDLPVPMQTFRRTLQELFLARFLGSRVAIGFTQIFPSMFRRVFVHQAVTNLPNVRHWLLERVQSFPIQRECPLVANFSSAPILWEALGLDPDRPLWLVNAGAKLPIKQWPAPYFAAVLRKLKTMDPALQVGLLGNAEERALNEDIVRAADHGINLAGQLSIPETMHLMTKAQRVLSNDTGAMHLAGLLKIPVVTPQSGQYPEQLWAPADTQWTSLVAPVGCAPCLQDQCRYVTQSCMLNILPEQVIRALC